MVSLFPKTTWKNHGLRADMVQMLADLKPGVHALPRRLHRRGALAHATATSGRRPSARSTSASSSSTAGTTSSNTGPRRTTSSRFGLGFFEYFQLCEDIGAEPLPILNCGMACQFNSGELVPLDQLDPYIQDALDLIEFANGPATSPWGAKRAAMGHPEPFNMKLLGVGNEQWGPQYIERYAAFAKVLKAKHPEIQLVSSAGPGPDDDKFHFALAEAARAEGRHRGRALLRAPRLVPRQRRALRQATTATARRSSWANTPRRASRPSARTTATTGNARSPRRPIMTGLERNADVVVMASYAPLFGHEEGWQWRPNLIWCDNLRAYGTPSYYVQQLFSRNRGDRVLPVRLKRRPAWEQAATPPLRDARRGTRRPAKSSSKSSTPRLIGSTPWCASRAWNEWAIPPGPPSSPANLADENSFDQPLRVSPIARPL